MSPLSCCLSDVFVTFLSISLRSAVRFLVFVAAVVRALVVVLVVIWFNSP